MPLAGALADRADPVRLVGLGAVLVAAGLALYGLLGALEVAPGATPSIQRVTAVIHFSYRVLLRNFSYTYLHVTFGEGNCIHTPVSDKECNAHGGPGAVAVRRGGARARCSPVRVLPRLRGAEPLQPTGKGAPWRKAPLVVKLFHRMLLRSAPSFKCGSRGPAGGGADAERPSGPPRRGAWRLGMLHAARRDGPREGGGAGRSSSSEQAQKMVTTFLFWPSNFDV